LNRELFPVLHFPGENIAHLVH